MDSAGNRIKQLALELQRILQENILENPSALVSQQMRRAREIQEEIKSFGFIVTWEVKINLSNPTKPNVIVNIWQPKKNLSPELQKIYDDWFMNR